MATRKKNVKDHRARRNMGSAEFFRKQRHERNIARGPQSVSTLIMPGKNGESDEVLITRVRD